MAEAALVMEHGKILCLDQHYVSSDKKEHTLTLDTAMLQASEHVSRSASGMGVHTQAIEHLQTDLCVFLKSLRVGVSLEGV